MPERFLTIIESRRDALLDDLRLHVSTPTGGFHTTGLDRTRALLTDRLRRLGASIDLVPGDPKPDWLFGVSPTSPIPPTAVCRGPAGVGPPILLAGHLDTVHDPVGPFRELTLAPDGVTATGPGCVDMKGGLVILVAALEALAEAGAMPNWSVVFNSDEETGSYHSEAVLRAEARRAAGGVGLAVEPALPDGSLAVERLGTGQFRIDARGRAAHVGRDFASGVSAVTALARALVAIGDLPDLTRDKIINVGPVEGGIATNVVPDRASAWGNVRFPSRQIADELQRDLAALERLGPASVHVRTSFNRPAKPQTPESLRLAALARHAAESLGQRLPFAKTGGVCDGNILQSEGLPTIDTLGVRGGGLHTPQEWIEIPSLVERCQLLALLMARIAAGAWT